uniref:40S ribosomal protein SA n=1 Tax=Mus musculus TaxID=10090 RepID=A0A1L1SUK3_MOUSE
MSGALDVLQMKEEDVLKFLAAGTHLGGTNLDFQMEQYIYKRKSDGIYIINLKRTWEKLLLAARAIVAIENPADVSVISSRNTGQVTRSGYQQFPREACMIMLTQSPFKASCAEVCCCHRSHSDRWPLHTWDLH